MTLIGSGPVAAEGFTLLAQEAGGDGGGPKPSYVSEGLIVGFLAAICLFLICKSSRRG